MGRTELGGICTSGPTAVYSGPSRLDVFCRGTDRALYQRAWFAGVGWLPGWFTVGGIATSDPDAASPGRRLVRRSCSSAAPTTAIYQLYWDGARWVIVNLGWRLHLGPFGDVLRAGPPRRVLPGHGHGDLAPLLVAPVGLVGMGAHRQLHHLGP